MFLNIFMFFPPVGGSQIIESQIHCNACVTVVEKFSRSIDWLKVFLCESAEQDVGLALAHMSNGCQGRECSVGTWVSGGFTSKYSGVV